MKNYKNLNKKILMIQKKQIINLEKLLLIQLCKKILISCIKKKRNFLKDNYNSVIKNIEPSVLNERYRRLPVLKK